MSSSARPSAAPAAGPLPVPPGRGPRRGRAWLRWAVAGAALAAAGLGAKFVLLDWSPIPASAPGAVDLAEAERLTGTDEESLPLRLNRLLVIESGFRRSNAVAGEYGPDYRSSIPTFQVVYGERTVVVDPTCDGETYKRLSVGHAFTFHPEAHAQMQRAMQKADRILVTHEHYDHANGIVAHPDRDAMLAKSMLTTEQIRNTKWIRNSGFDEASLARVQEVRYDRVTRVLPGIVLIKAPGHSLGSQIVYVRLRGGNRFLLAGDLVWHMDAVRLCRGKSRLMAFFLQENLGQAGRLIRWVHDELTERKAPGRFFVPSHDQDHMEGFVARGLIGSTFEGV